MHIVITSAKDQLTQASRTRLITDRSAPHMMVMKEGDGEKRPRTGSQDLNGGEELLTVQCP